MSKMKLGKPIELNITKRYYEFQSQYAIRDVFDALVELITNSDDSYGRLYKRQLRGEDGGPILIDVLKRMGGVTSVVIVRDRAEGMTLQKMIQKFIYVGARRSEEGDRGFMGRGLKDLTALGNVIVESIKYERYYKCQLSTKQGFVPLVDKRKINKQIRKELHIERGNGTVVTLEILPEHRIPRIDTIISNLRWHFALRDILSEHSSTKCLVRNVNKPKQKPEKIVSMQPDGELVCKEEFKVRGYEAATATLMIWKAPQPFDDSADRRFRRSGLIVKGEGQVKKLAFYKHVLIKIHMRQNTLDG